MARCLHVGMCGCAGVTFLNGSSTTLAAYAGKVLMITNVAVRCAGMLCEMTAKQRHALPLAHHLCRASEGRRSPT